MRRFYRLARRAAAAAATALAAAAPRARAQASGQSDTYVISHRYRMTSGRAPSGRGKTRRRRAPGGGSHGRQTQKIPTQERERRA